MSVTRSTLIGGPAKIVRGAVTLFSEDDFRIEPKPAMQDVNSSVHGRVDATQDDVVYEVSFTPVGVWAYIAALFPYIGNGTAGTESVRGYRVMTDADVPLVITGKEGGIYTLKAAAVTKMPDILLGPTKSLFGPVTFQGVVGNGLEPEAADSFMSIGSGAYSDATFDPTAIKRQRYAAAWSGVTGFTAFQAQDFWTVQSELQLQPVKVQGYTRDLKIDSIKFMAKCIPVGPTSAQIETALKAQGTGGAEGRRLSASAADLVITGSGVSVTLKNCNLKTAGHVFGGVPLRNGELGWETTIAFSAGVPACQLVLA